MDKPNVFKSSSFHMDAQDVLHILIKGLTGTGVTIGLNGESGGESNEEDSIVVSPIAPSPLMDKDGNEYTTVQIGMQEWIIENLRTTKYADGTAIPNLTLDADWIAEDGNAGHDGAYCWYDNDIANKTPYGALYNWHAINKKFDDWFLPSKDEVNEIRSAGIDGLSIYYWSSTEIDATLAFRSYNGPSAVKNTANSVRAIRAFTSTTNYNLRDIGPAGGYIFWKSGNDYLECAPTDQSASQTWSNIIDVEIGVTAQGTAIGTGQANTTAIIAQVGHTSSAAKLCNDLIVNYGDKLAVGQFTQGGNPSVGWRVPNLVDFNNLMTEIGVTYDVDNGWWTDAGGKLKEIGTTHWLDPNTGATDEFGFRSVGNGLRNENMLGDFESFGIFGTFWIDEGVPYPPFELNLIGETHRGDSNLLPIYSQWYMGFGVRCMRDI